MRSFAKEGRDMKKSLPSLVRAPSQQPQKGRGTKTSPAPISDLIQQNLLVHDIHNSVLVDLCGGLAGYVALFQVSICQPWSSLEIPPPAECSCTHESWRCLKLQTYNFHSLAVTLAGHNFPCPIQSASLDLWSPEWFGSWIFIWRAVSSLITLLVHCVLPGRLSCCCYWLWGRLGWWAPNGDPSQWQPRSRGTPFPLKSARLCH